jgi:hypothetical protein
MTELAVARAIWDARPGGYGAAGRVGEDAASRDTGDETASGGGRDGLCDQARQNA